jgi:hypothetical protein
MPRCRSRAIAGSATVVTVPSTNTAPDPKIDPIRIQRERSVVVVRLVLSLRVNALVRLTRIALLRRAHGLLSRALRPHGRQRQQPLEILAPTFGARGYGSTADERLEHVATSAA